MVYKSKTDHVTQKYWCCGGQALNQTVSFTQQLQSRLNFNLKADDAERLLKNIHWNTCFFFKDSLYILIKLQHCPD